MEREVKKIFAKKDSGIVRIYHSVEEMNAAGFTEADDVTTEDIYNSKGCYARIGANGEIIYGKTEEEEAAEETEQKIAEIKNRFNEIDRLDGPRPIREAITHLANAAGLDTSYLNRHETEAVELREKLADLQQSA